jgi:hypothetical protein
MDRKGRVTVFSVLVVWSLISVVATLALGHWLGRADAVPSFHDDDLRISR